MIKIASPAFAQNSFIPQKYTCRGKNINPPIFIKNVPENAKSLVLICDDPDAVNGVFTHWILCNINPETSEIKEGSFLKGVISGSNSSGSNNYTGPCPPSGTHRYFFTIYALDEVLNVKNGATRREIDLAMQHHIIEQGQLMGKFTKQ